MNRFSVVLCIAFFYSGAVFGWVQDESGRIASETAQPDTGPQGTDKQVESNRVDIVEAVKNTAEVKETVTDIKADVERIDHTTQTYDFIIKLLATISPVMLALIAWLQIKSQRDAERRDLRRHEDMQSIERSVDGMQSKVVAVATAAGFEEGAAIDTSKPAGKAVYQERSAELKEEVKLAKADQRDASEQSKSDMSDNKI